MKNAGRFCQQCNNLVDANQVDRVCAECAQKLSFSKFASTVDLANPTSFESIADCITVDEGFEKQLVGRKIGQYNIQSLLGKGGMAWVFLAWHNTLHRPCAIKVLCPELLGRQADSLDLFIAEARAAASLVHPHIVAVHNVGELESNHFIEMEYVQGCSLDHLISQQSLLSPSASTGYLLQSSSALNAAHHQSLVHGDFKPANILVRSDGTAKLADFGLAKKLSMQTTSGNGRLMGTPHFMAPELFQGEPASKLSDIYAVGISYFYALTGRFPFNDTTIIGLSQSHFQKEIPDPRTFRDDIPGDAVALIAKCVAKNPQDRFPDSDALLQELQRVYGGMRDLPALVTKALAAWDADVQSNVDRIIINIRLAGRRSQNVYIEFCPISSTESRLIRIFSVCAPVDDKYLRRALEFNATMSHGALAIQDINGEPYFVMLNSHLQATCEAEDVCRSVLEVAQRADDVERMLTGRDDR